MSENKEKSVISQSSDLTNFYRSYDDWIESGASEDHSFFARNYGLCSNLYGYIWSTGKTYLYQELSDEMQSQFIRSGLAGDYPFGGYDLFDEEHENRTTYLNPDRIKWVKDHTFRQAGRFFFPDLSS